MESLIPAVSTLVSSIVPSQDINVRIQSGILAGEMMRLGVKQSSTITSWIPIPSWFRSNKLYISQRLDGERHSNPVFDQLQEYIIAKHFDKLDTAQLVPKKGEITLFPKKGLKLDDVYEGQHLDISMNFAASDEGNPDPSKSNYHSQIIISSRRLPLEKLKCYVQSICKLDRVMHSTIAVYRPLIQRGRKEEGNYVEWDKIFMKTNKTLENTIYSDAVVKQVFTDVEWFMNNEQWFTSRGIPYKRGYILHGPPGTGKCLGRGTPVLMWDGFVKKIEDVVVGDVLVGDDSTPRTVKSLGRGRDKMYNIKQQDTSDYIVNSKHILTLYISGNRKVVYDETCNPHPFGVRYFDHTSLKFVTQYFETNPAAKHFSNVLLNGTSPDVIDIELEKYMNLDEHDRIVLKGLRVTVNWPRQYVEVDPYCLGYWFGYWIGKPRVEGDDELPQHLIQTTNRLEYQHEQTRFALFVKQYNLVDNKHIPTHFKRNYRKYLFRLLAGMIDSNGTKLEGGIYEFIQESALLNDVQFICNSVGLCFTVVGQEPPYTCMHTHNVIYYYRVRISRHRPNHKPSISQLITDITIEELEVGEYFGVVLDGNERFLLGDFTVTHNTSVAKIIANKYHLPIFVLDLQSIDNNSDFTKLVTEINYLTDKRYIISIEDLDRCDMFRNKWYTESGKFISIQCFLNFLDGVVETHGRICIFSANDINVLDGHQSSVAMFRPGRIDCKVEIQNCTVGQLSKLYKLFYEQDLDQADIKTAIDMSPAQVINIMSKINKEEVYKYLTTGDTIVSILPTDSELNVQGLLGAESTTVNARNRRGKCMKGNRCGRHVDPIAKLRRKQRQLGKAEKLIIDTMKRTERMKYTMKLELEKILKQKNDMIEKEYDQTSKPRPNPRPNPKSKPRPKPNPKPNPRPNPKSNPTPKRKKTNGTKTCGNKRQKVEANPILTREKISEPPTSSVSPTSPASSKDNKETETGYRATRSARIRNKSK